MERCTRVGLWVGGLALAAALAGCNNPLFPPDAARTPYDRYLALRGQERPMAELDVNGRERPALRRRLAPLDTP